MVSALERFHCKSSYDQESGCKIILQWNLQDGHTIKWTLYKMDKDFAPTLQVSIKQTLSYGSNGVRFREIPYRRQADYNWSPYFTLTTLIKWTLINAALILTKEVRNFENLICDCLFLKNFGLFILGQPRLENSLASYIILWDQYHLEWKKIITLTVYWTAIEYTKLFIL